MAECPRSSSSFLSRERASIKDSDVTPAYRSSTSPQENLQQTAS
jgi:hypothetical protein